MSELLHDVAIVGFGPSGAVAAALLGQAGHTVLVIDRTPEVYPLPRAIALDHEILRVFQKLGLADAIVPHTEPFTDSCFYGVDGQIIRRMTMVAPPYPQGWTPSVVFNQPAVEGVLRDAVRALPNVALRLDAAVSGIEQGDECATLTLADGHVARARYVIGCDGASSTVRGSLGIALEDLGFDEPWLVVDVLANERGVATLPKESAQYCQPERPCSYIIGPKNHRRWEISLKDGESPSDVVAPGATWKLLERWITPDQGTLWRQAAYRFHALVAERWRHGRVFLAGDAAHQQPPFLGQGMCQGVRDVVNLGWKLDAVLRGDAPDALLDSYGLERKAHVKELTTRLKAIGGLIGVRDAAQARARDARLLAEAGGRIAPTPRQDVLPRLQAGLLAEPDTSARGTLFPQPWTRPAGGGAPVRMDERVGSGWRLIMRDDASQASRVDPRIDGRTGAGTDGHHAGPGLRTLNLTELDEVDGVLAAWFTTHHCAAALVRPDHYVFGTAATPAEIAPLLAQARTHVG